VSFPSGVYVICDMLPYLGNLSIHFLHFIGNVLPSSASILNKDQIKEDDVGGV
jgi:hypothetical protein